MAFAREVPPNNANERDRPSCFLSQDINACGVAGGALLAALAWRKTTLTASQKFTSNVF